MKGQIINQDFNGPHIQDGALTTAFGYKVLGNLRRATLPGGPTIDQVIDGQNRREGRKIDGVLLQGFPYKNQLNRIAELDGDNILVSRFVYGTRIDVPDYMEREAEIK